MFHRLYLWTMSLAGHRHAAGWLAFISFLESSIFPIPPDAMLIPMCLAQPKKAWRYALICTLASIAGALLGYAIGALLFETIGRAILDFYGYQAQFLRFQEKFTEYGALAVLIFGLTPLPYKVITIASGVAAMPLLPFLLASIVARAARFFLVAALLWKYGAPLRIFIEKRLNLLISLFTILLVGGFVAIKFLF